MKRWIHATEEYRIWEDPDLQYVSNVNGYQVYRKIVDGRGKWFAHHQDDPIETMFPITYQQALGYEDMPNASEIEKLQRKLGKMLLPVRSGTETRDPNWIDPEILMDEEFDSSGDEMEEFWQTYLSDSEDEVYNEFEIMTEPSGQGMFATMYLVDDSGQERFEPIGIDWTEWCEKEIQMAIDSNSAEEYKQKFRAYIKDLCKIQ